MKGRVNREVQARFPACVPLRLAGEGGLGVKSPFTYPILIQFIIGLMFFNKAIFYNTSLKN